MHAEVHDELRDQLAAVVSDRAGIEVPDAEPARSTLSRGAGADSP